MSWQLFFEPFKRLEAIGSKKNNLIIAIGPSIKGDKYQVDKKDVEDLTIQLTEKRFIGKSLCINKIKEEEIIPLFKKDSNSNKILIDLQAAAILQLFKEGIKQHQIDINRICTYSNPNLFNSYKKDKTNSRLWSCIYS